MASQGEKKRGPEGPEQPMLSGDDGEERLVDVAMTSRDPCRMTLYSRREDGRVSWRTERHRPFFLVEDPSLLRGYRGNCRVEHLKTGRQAEGARPYKAIASFDSWGAMWGGKKHVEKKAASGERSGSGSGQRGNDPLYLMTDPAKQYLMRSGKTLFGGMQPEDLLTLSVDIEAYSKGHFPQADNPEDEVFIISMSASDGREWLLHTGPRGAAAGVAAGRSSALEGPLGGGAFAYRDEEQLLSQFFRSVSKIDPDVIAGHHFLGFDGQYLRERAARYGVDFELGRPDAGTRPRQRESVSTVGGRGELPRHASEAQFYETSQRFAERSVEFTGIRANGRHFIDSYLQSLSYDVFARDLPAYDLKTVARHFGLASSGGSGEERTYIEGDRIAEVWDEDPGRVLRYALDDARESLRIYSHLSGSDFYTSQLLPMRFGDTARSGPAEKIEGLMTREYLRSREALPAPSPGSMGAGGYTGVYYTGVVGPIVYADVESMYPSIMLAEEIGPGKEKDPKDLFGYLLRNLTDMRFEAKSKMKEKKKRLAKLKEQGRGASKEYERVARAKSELDGRQSSYKVLINAKFGSLGFRGFPWNNFEAATEVTRVGRRLIKKIRDEIEKDGGQAIEIDTDGVIFVPPDGVESHPGATDDIEYVRGLTERLPEGIRVGFDGRSRSMVSYKKKNYAVLGYDGKLKIKGGSFKSRSGVSFKREFVQGVLRDLAEGDVEGIHERYCNLRERLTNREMPPEALAKTVTLKDVEKYRRKTQAGDRARDAAYELAFRMHEEGRRSAPQAGDRITYYVSGSSRGERVFEKAEPIEDYRPGDEDLSHYLGHLEKATEKFLPFFEGGAFRDVFSPDDGLFKADLSGVELLVTEVPQPEEAQAAGSGGRETEDPGAEEFFERKKREHREEKEESSPREEREGPPAEEREGPGVPSEGPPPAPQEGPGDKEKVAGEARATVAAAAVKEEERAGGSSGPGRKGSAAKGSPEASAQEPPPRAAPSGGEAKEKSKSGPEAGLGL